MQIAIFMDIIIFHARFTEINLLQGDTVPLMVRCTKKNVCKFFAQIIEILCFFFYFLGDLDSNSSAVVGGTAELPCEITPETQDDKTHLVLWYKQDSVNPIYT